MGTATPGSFKKAKYSEVTLPSGNVVRLKRVSIEEWIATGEVPNTLKAVLDKALRGERPSKEDVLGGDEMTEERMADLMKLWDFAVVKCMVEPRCYPAPKDEDDRDDERLYSDEIGSEDKSFIFYWTTGGSNDVKRFREQSLTALDDLEEVQDVDDKAVPVDRAV